MGPSLAAPSSSHWVLHFRSDFRNVDDISISVIGDGVFDEGISYEIFNLAALHRLPLLIICENNKYAAHSPIEHRQALPRLAERAQAFGLPAERLDGNDSEQLLLALERLLPLVRTGGGPRFIEIETYRYCGHVGPGNDEGMSYRPADEVAQWLARDPLPAMRKRLDDTTPKSTLNKIEADINAKIDAAIATAKRADYADIKKVINSNWSNEYSAVVRQFVSDGKAGFQSGQLEARPGPF